MRIHLTQPLFAWDALEDHPTLSTVRAFLDCIPDQDLLASLRAWRGNGRGDYPVHVLWGVAMLQLALRHPTMDGCLGELRRNRELARLIGIESEAGVPKKWNMSRFLATLGREPHLAHLRKVFDAMVKHLGVGVEDLGRHVSGDSTHLSARPSRTKKGQKKGALPEADKGRKEYRDEAGKVASVIEWMGYKLHVLVDVKHEVAVAWRVSAASVHDAQELEGLVQQAQGNLPENRIQTLAYDKATDGEKTHEMLGREKIAPVIQIRSLWRPEQGPDGKEGEQERMLPGHDGKSKVVYDEAGTVYCYDTASEPPVRRKMAYLGHEASRGTLKYRCPARHEGWACPQDAACNGSGKYGRTVRVKQEMDLRRFPPIPRATKKFEQLYKGRTAVERFNARAKVFWGADDGNVTGAERFHALVGAVMITHAAMATLLARAPRWEGTLGLTRISPIADALNAKPRR